MGIEIMLVFLENPLVKLKSIGSQLGTDLELAVRHTQLKGTTHPIWPTQEFSEVSKVQRHSKALRFPAQKLMSTWRIEVL